MAITITDTNNFEITIDRGDGVEYVIWKQNIRFGTIDGDVLPLFWHDKARAGRFNNIDLNYTDVSNPVVASAAALQTAIENMIKSGWASPGGSGVGIWAHDISVSSGTVHFSNSNNVSFGMSGSTVTASASFAQSVQPVAVSGSNGSFTFNTLSLGTGNGASFYSSNGSIVLSYTVPSITNSSWTVSDSATSGTVGRLAFTNLNGVTLSLSTGANGSHTIVGSHNGLTSQSNQALSGSNGSFTFQTASFGTLNGISFYTSNGSIVASHNAITSQSVQPVAISGSNGSFAFSTVTFGNLNGVSFYTSNGSVVASYTVGGGAGVTLSKFPIYPINPAFAATVNSGTVASTGGSSQVTASYHVASMPVQHDFNYSQISAAFAFTATSAGTGSATVGHGIGLYTLNANTALSLVTSWQWQMFVSQNNITNRTHHQFWGVASNANSTAANGNLSASYTGTRYIKMNDANGTITAGNYYLVSVYTCSSAGVDVYNIGSQGIDFALATNLGSMIGENSISRFIGWNGVFSTTSNRTSVVNPIMPTSIHTSAITIASVNTSNYRSPILLFQRSIS